MNDFIKSCKITGDIYVENKKINQKNVVVEELRKKVGMVFQKPNPFPKSIFENIAYGLKIQSVKDKETIKNELKNL